MDTYKTITAPAEAIYKEKMSKFIAYAYPVTNVQEFESRLSELQKKHYDARHICWAYMLGHERLEFRSNDNGEPSGTAGKPILGQINSRNLTDIAVLVVRYFGGIKLGTGGLIVAYKESAAQALDGAQVIECVVKREYEIRVLYIALNDVMKVIKEEELEIRTQIFDLECTITVAIRLDDYDRIVQRLNS